MTRRFEAARGARFRANDDGSYLSTGWLYFLVQRRARWLVVAMIAVTLGLAAVAARLNGSASEDGVPPAASTAGKPVIDEMYRWRPVAIGAGGFITGISIDDSGNTRVARADVHGAYLWDAQLDKWRQLVSATTFPETDRQQNGMNEGVYEIVVAPQDPERLYMAIKGGVYHSEDRGAHWTKAVGVPNMAVQFDANSRYRMYGPFLAVDPRDKNHVFFGTPNAGLWQSRDGGANWTQSASVPLPVQIEAAQKAPPGIMIWFDRSAGKATGQRIFVMVPGRGMFASGDGGASFAELTDVRGPSPKTLKQGVFTRDGSFIGVDPLGKRVWRWRAREGWADLSPSVPGARAWAAIAVHAPDDTIYILDEGGRIARSFDAGANWLPLLRSVSAGLKDPPWLRVANQGYFATAMIAFDPVDHDTLWIAAGTGVWRTTVAGALLRLSFVSESRGIEELVANDVVQPPGHAPLFASWDFGIHVRPDLDRYSTGYGPRERVIIAAQQIAITPALPGFVVTNASDTRLGCCAEDGQSVLAGYSTDGGKTWTRFTSLPQPPGTSANDPWRMSFGTIAVASGDPDTIVWEPSFNRAPFYTRDRGANWSRVAFPGERLPNTGSHAALHLQRKTLLADPLAPLTFYLVHSGSDSNPQLAGLWRTIDGGERWTKIFDGEIAPDSGFAAKLRAVPGRKGDLYFTSGVAGGTDTHLRHSNDGGMTWKVVAGVDHVDDIAFGKPMAGSSVPTIFLSGRVNGTYGLWRSVDDGKQWARLIDFPIGRLDQVTVMEGDKDVFGRVYIGYLGSGWMYGEPAPCTAVMLQASSIEQCNAVQPLVSALR